MQWISVAVGGALGALARWSLAGLTYGTMGTAFPWGTLTVNVLGCFGLGAVAVWADAAVAAEWIRSAVAVGFLGAFTTFSTFSLESLRLLQEGEGARAAGYIAVSVGLGLGAVVTGMALARWGLTRPG
ncbi:MAG: fluoride efflux transporter CrcB [Longimicrobiales bacterium]|nr:fluoride efflux transporter CrcB [Longimicrobiales bacterium]